MKHSPGPSRTPSNLSDSIHQQLNRYALAASAAGVSVLALAQPAQAKIIYTPTHKRLPINQDFFLDLNHDGTNDFKFHIVDSGNARGSQTHDSFAALYVYPVAAGNEVVGKNGFRGYASALRAGVRIGSKVQFINNSRILMGGIQSITHFSAFGAWAASGQGVNGRYLGLEFLIKGKVHFGWARFNVKPGFGNSFKAVLTGYAYETIANKSIIAGKTMGPDDASLEESSATPEPTPCVTLGLLALGAPGLSIWRRKEAVVATQ